MGVSVFVREVPLYVCSAMPLGSLQKDEEYMYRGTSPIINSPPPQDPPRTLGIGLP